MIPHVTVCEASITQLSLDQCETLLCPSRLDALSRISHPQAQAASLTGDLLLCAAVRHVRPDTAFPLVRAARPSGQPYLTDFPDLHLSISHSGDRVLCAVADVPVGIDLELPRPVRPGLAARWFDADEQALIARDSSTFFDLWMVKEAVLKETGCGLAHGLREVSVALDPLPHLTRPVFGQLHAIARVRLSCGHHAMLSVPGTVSPAATVLSPHITDFL